MDASSNGTINGSTNIGKGLLFPSTDLTTFATFNVSGPLGIDANYPTFFDGMVVYNTATGTSAIGAVAVTPGYYYYSNPGQTFPTGSATAGTWMPMGGGGVTDTPTFEPATEMDVNLSDPLVTPVISTETATSVFTFVNTRDRESGDKTTQIMNLPPPTPVGKLIIINNSANSLNVQFNPSVGGNNVVAAYRGVMLIATADGWLNLSE